jgi:FSR family fosmidomycin resistance protein-like MFS transporter
MHSILPVLVSSYSGKEIGKGMSYWMVGGDIGIMVAPLIVTAVITTSSTSALPWLMIGGIVISLLLNFLLKDEPYVKSNNGEHKSIPIKDLLAIMLPLAGIISMRSILRSSTTIYLSVYLIEKGANVWLAGSALSIVQAFGAVGIILGGIAKDRYGFKPAMMFSVICSSVGMLLFIFSSGALQIVALALLGGSLMMILPVAMATVQENFKENRSLANGIYLALLFAINALAGVLTGFLYDQLGGFTTFLIGGLLSFLGIPFVFMLPSYDKES